MATILNNSTQKALTTLARAKSFLGISGDSQDTVLIMMINQVTGFIETYTKRRMLRQTYTDEKYDGTGFDTLVLKQWPVSALSALKENTSTPGDPSYQTIDSSRYTYYEDGRVVFGSGGDRFIAGSETFIDDPKRYSATYTAGYLISFDNENDPAQHTLPQEIEYACLKLMSAQFNRRKSEGLDSARVGDIQMSFRATVSSDPEIKEILSKYSAPGI